MGQTWQILNTTLRERMGGAKLGEFFFDDFIALYDTLRVCSLPKSFDTWLTRGPVALQPGPFGKLSAEIIEMIFENMPEDKTGYVVIFAVTCKRLLSIGKPFVLRYLRRRHSPWAFERLICLGEYTMDDDLPKGLLTDEQRAEISTVELDGYEEEHMSLYTVASELYTRRREVSGYEQYKLDEELKLLLKKSREEATKCSDAKRLLELDMIEALGAFAFSPTYPRLGALVLCNVSKAEYVREDKLTEMKITWNGKYSHTLGLPQALLSRICWSSDDSIAMVCEEPYCERLANGPWAGDRFCITTLEDMPRAGRGKTWKDVTGEVDELLVHLWEKNMAEE